MVDLSESAGAQGRIGRGKLRAVEQVKEFRPEFEVHPLCEVGSLEYGEVKVDNPVLP